MKGAYIGAGGIRGQGCSDEVPPARVRCYTAVSEREVYIDEGAHSRRPLSRLFLLPFPAHLALLLPPSSQALESSRGQGCLLPKLSGSQIFFFTLCKDTCGKDTGFALVQMLGEACLALNFECG